MFDGPPIVGARSVKLQWEEERSCYSCEMYEASGPTHSLTCDGIMF